MRIRIQPDPLQTQEIIEPDPIRLDKTIFLIFFYKLISFFSQTKILLFQYNFSLLLLMAAYEIFKIRIQKNGGRIQLVKKYIRIRNFA